MGLTSSRVRQRLSDLLANAGIADERVLEAIARVPRHLFVDEALAGRAYEDCALPIGLGQSISQPFVVARMTEALLAEGIPERVLEIGTGSGYQAAVLAEIVPRVYSLERIVALYRRSRKLLQSIGYRNVFLRHSDGMVGWPAQAPFDAIIVTAGAEDVPDALFEQLRPGGRLVMPVGPQGHQTLSLYRRGPEGYEFEDLGAVSFVPLLGGQE